MSKGNLWRLRALWLASAAALACPAFADDKPADDAGAKAIADFVAAYGGKVALPSVKIKADGTGYWVSFDLGSASDVVKPMGFAYDPVEMKFHVFQQTDGQWRVENTAPTVITGHYMQPNGDNAVKIDTKIEPTNFHSVTLLDSNLDWLSSSHGAADKISVTQHGPGIEEFLEIGGLKFDAVTKKDAEGLTTEASEPFDTLNMVIDVDPKGVDPTTNGPAKPVHISAEGKKATAALALTHFQPGPLLDAWRFAAAHPSRPDYARDIAELKTIVTALTSDHMTFGETITLDKLDVMSQLGPVAIEGASFGVGAINNGSDSGFSESFAAKSLKLPDGLAPPMYAALIPTSFDIGFKATGFDVASAAQEWLNDAKFDGDGPPLTPEDQANVKQKLIGQHPVVVDISPSHIAAPGLDLSFEGEVTLEGGLPVASTLTIKVKDFDKTTAAVQGMGPQAAQQLVPALAMAKGLGKPAADGSLLWVCTLGRDHVMKVNGLPLGKAPF